jgi:hypothetical protein
MDSTLKHYLTKTPYFILFVAFAAGFYWYLQGYAGSDSAKASLNSLLSLMKSVGFLLVVIPILSNLLSEISHQRFSWIQFTFQFFSFLFTTLFLVSFSNETYFGLETLPGNGVYVFSLSFILGWVTSMIHLVRNFKKNTNTSNVLKAFLFAAMGIVLANFLLQLTFFVSELKINSYVISILFSLFFKQLIFVTALSGLFLKLILTFRHQSKYLKLSVVTFGILTQLGFLSSQNDSNLIYVLSQFSLCLGLSGYFSVFLILFSRRIRTASQQFIDGEWVMYILIFLALISYSIAQFASLNTLSGSALNDMIFLLVALALPVLHEIILARKRFSSSITQDLFYVFIFTGTFGFFLTWLKLSPFGINFSSMSDTLFSPLVGLSSFCLFIIFTGCCVFVWDRVLLKIHLRNE